MYDSVTHFLKTFSADQPILWALLVMAVVATISLTMYAFWELVWRLLFPGNSSTKKGRGSRG